MKLVLASRSPRRRELLTAAGIDHIVRAVDVDESLLAGETPIFYVRRLAEAKANAAGMAPGEVVLGADTSVVCGDRILGKPRDAHDARQMLELLSGRDHEVITGLCLRHPKGIAVAHDVTRVWFAPFTANAIEELIASGEPMDKAGAYAIQGIASRYIDRIAGSYSNVVGLPIALVWRELEKLRNFPS